MYQRHKYIDIAVTFFAFGLLTGGILTAASCQPDPHPHHITTGGHP